MNYQQIVNNNLSLHGITVKKYRTTSSGKAWSKSKTVEIPKPTNADRFLLCMHEIAHVIFKHGTSSKPKYIREYEAEQYAIQQGRYHNVPEIELNRYIVRARGYVAMKIAQGYLRGLNLKNISQEIRNWLRIDFSEWENCYVLIVRDKDGFLIRYLDKETREEKSSKVFLSE